MSRSCSLLLHYLFGVITRLVRVLVFFVVVPLRYSLRFGFPSRWCSSFCLLLLYYWLYYWYGSYCSNHHCLLCSISTTKRIITRRVRSTYQSISLSFRTGSFFLYLRVLLRPPTPTATAIPLFFVIVESILNLIRTHLSRRLIFLLYVSVTILSIGTTTMYQL